ncbi:MAG: hypothetical protein HQL93_09650 [Magnetococcales bacterium]|nr:hypothetical protein [Magnetococcales bacterium]
MTNTDAALDYRGGKNPWQQGGGLLRRYFTSTNPTKKQTSAPQCRTQREECRIFKKPHSTSSRGRPCGDTFRFHGPVVAHC